MAIATYEPEKRNEIIKRRQERGAIEPPKGAKFIGEWNVIGFPAQIDQAYLKRCAKR